MSSGSSALNITIVSCSIDPRSRSRRLAHVAERILREAGHAPQLFDLRDVSLPAFDNADCYDDAGYVALHGAIRDSDGVILAVPVYNWSIGSAAKTLIELTGATGARGLTSAWFDQIVTFLCAGGLPQSYMAYSQTAITLMLDFKCIINPYVVYASSRDLTAEGRLSGALSTRLRKTLDVKVELAALLRGRQYTSDWEI